MGGESRGLPRSQEQIEESDVTLKRTASERTAQADVDTEADVDGLSIPIDWNEPGAEERNRWTQQTERRRSKIVTHHRISRSVGPFEPASPSASSSPGSDQRISKGVLGAEWEWAIQPLRDNEYEISSSSSSSGGGGGSKTSKRKSLGLKKEDEQKAGSDENKGHQRNSVVEWK